jgi:hypothetical protein
MQHRLYFECDDAGSPDPPSKWKILRSAGQVSFAPISDSMSQLVDTKGRGSATNAYKVLENIEKIHKLLINIYDSTKPAKYRLLILRTQNSLYAGEVTI